MKLTLSFSPCPNDTFIFDALIHQKIDTEGLEFEVVLADVEALNKSALKQLPDITKLSYGVLPLVLEHYVLLNSGSALGKGVGPLLITKEPLQPHLIHEQQIAIPGEHTTAHLLFSMAYPAAKHKIFMRYDAIESFVLDGKGLGVIIHENRFTYQDKGLKLLTDLGAYWEQTTAEPIPLGGIVIKRDLDPAIHFKVERLIRKSIGYAYSKYPELNDYIRMHAQEMSEDVMRKHIELYVNNYSLMLGKEGKSAVNKIIEVFTQTHNYMLPAKEIFLH